MKIRPSVFLLIFTNLFLITSCQLTELHENVPPEPTAIFTFTNDCNGLPCTINFNTSDAIGDKFEWDMTGNQEIDVEGENPSYTYEVAGTYEVTLYVTRNGRTDVKTHSTTITINNAACDVTSAFSIQVISNGCFNNCRIQLENQSQGSGLIYSWDFGDGNTAADREPTHTFSTPREDPYRITLEIEDVNGCQAAASQSIAVNYLTFEKYIGGSREEELHDIIQTTNGEFLAIGFSKSGTSQTGIDRNTFFGKLNQIGEETTTKVVGDFNEDEGVSFVLNQNNILVLSSGGEQGMFLQELSTTGNRINEWHYGNKGGRTYQGTRILKTSTNQIILTGESGGRALILYHPSGSSATYPAVSGAVHDINLGVTDRTIVVTGEDNRDAFFSILSNDGPGNEVHQTYGHFDHEEIGYVVKPESINGGYLIVGSIERDYNAPVGNNARDILVVKIDQDGNEEWLKSYGGSSEDVGYDFIETSRGTYLIVGMTKSSGAGQEDVYLLEIDEDGFEIQDATFGGASKDIGYAVKETSDGGFIIAGTTNSFGNGAQGYIIKTNPDLEVN